MTVDAPRAQGLISFVARPSGAPARTRHLDASRLSPAFCAVMLCSLDGLPVARAERLLLVAAARVANSGMEWNAERTTLIEWGGAAAGISAPVTSVLPAVPWIGLHLFPARETVLLKLKVSDESKGYPVAA